MRSDNDKMKKEQHVRAAAAAAAAELAAVKVAVLPAKSLCIHAHFIECFSKPLS